MRRNRAKVSGGRLLPSFEAYRLNKGVADTVESLLLSADVWERAEGNAPVGLRYCLGLDLGTSASQSAAAAYLAGLWQARLLCGVPVYP